MNSDSIGRPIDQQMRTVSIYPKRVACSSSWKKKTVTPVRFWLLLLSSLLCRPGPTPVPLALAFLPEGRPIEPTRPRWRTSARCLCASSTGFQSNLHTWRGRPGSCGARLATRKRRRSISLRCCAVATRKLKAFVRLSASLRRLPASLVFLLPMAASLPRPPPTLRPGLSFLPHGGRPPHPAFTGLAFSNGPRAASCWWRRRLRGPAGSTPAKLTG